MQHIERLTREQWIHVYLCTEPLIAQAPNHPRTTSLYFRATLCLLPIMSDALRCLLTLFSSGTYSRRHCSSCGAGLYSCSQQLCTRWRGFLKETTCHQSNREFLLLVSAAIPLLESKEPTITSSPAFFTEITTVGLVKRCSETPNNALMLKSCEDVLIEA